jgi:excisionase family DNA binding protein
MDILKESRLLSTEEVGKYLGVQARTVRNWINQEELKGVKVRTLWRVRPEDLRAFLQEPPARKEEGA